MRLAVFGLGYVGAVTAALFAEQGHRVVGVDLNPDKVAALAAGKPPVVEPGLAEVVAGAVDSGRLRAVTEAADAGSDWEVAFVCVGTPSAAGGQLDDRALRAVLDELGAQLRGRDDYPVVAVRSTVAPHVIERVIVPTLTDAAGDRPGSFYGLAVVPEFLREGTSVKDFHHPPFTLIGCEHRQTFARLAPLFDFIDAELLQMTMGEAVMVKYASNAYHAVKVAFANEIGLLCARDGMDSHRVMAAFCRDTKLNVSKAYLRPGFAFGGSCLPKDLRELNHRARQNDLDTPLLNAVLPSNRAYLARCIDIVLATGTRRVAVLGMSFKADTDDLRESPMLDLIEALMGKGKRLAVYDSNVSLARLTGTNRAYLEQTIPHIAELLKPTVAEAITDAELVLVGYHSGEFDGLESRLADGQQLIDFSDPLRPAFFTGSDCPPR